MIRSGMCTKINIRSVQQTAGIVVRATNAMAIGLSGNRRHFGQETEDLLITQLNIVLEDVQILWMSDWRVGGAYG